ncbi:uncharacterized protein EI90DRAFT_3064502 [Cantharellus anzutake]|uniref:uncharacterized protein n=1 Tax=Cantharellus anzutake TaxID=1750568 RepID=UPI0019060C46|nr:uncharacterized protein EI90DRAFT_3064502 [Cantharellus anzutake]KAF8328535.1 hypothetical protein EI90DRAFT_3064502 [Cantharellus anzutake]
MSEPATRRTRSATSALKPNDPYSQRPVRELRSRNRNRVPASDEDSQSQPTIEPRYSRSGRPIIAKYQDLSDDEDEDDLSRKSLARSQTRTRRSQRYASRGDDFIERDEDDDGDVLSDAEYGVRRSSRRVQSAAPSRTAAPQPKRPSRGARNRGKSIKNDDGEAEFQLSPKGEASDSDFDLSHVDDAPITSLSPTPPPQQTTRSRRISILSSPRGYTLRPQRKTVNYQIPPLLDNDQLASLQAEVKNVRSNVKSKSRVGFTRTGSQGILGTPSTLPAPPPLVDDSDSDDPNAQAMKANLAGGAGSSAGGLIGTGSLKSGTDIAAAAGGPANFGKISKDSALADTDPLGPNVNVTFDQVGGLDDHIASLKEMVSLPLLYPEIFQQFKITPPRGVLFHGPPGTGKTLLARALAASSRSGGRDIAFFMRKGADILSKWVGEAERQLRLLFDEARNCQPSIIFFDEIDGLAPVRSSKQDQIHASIVSTLLALMDGMDGRGQVIVIGATNRPDAVDPALRRPGRFDREFYFPLPDLRARKQILRILTSGWKGWERDSVEGERMLQVMAEATKGYGGADLRALATEATLNAVQRTYPQIYKSRDRLLVNPDNIRVLPKDFMMSVKKLIPSSKRSTASAAAPLPKQLIALLDGTLSRIKEFLSRTMPSIKARNALEEAEWEDDDDDGGLTRELRLQAMESLRVYRPRLLVHGAPGMGQSYLGPAALHHLEGFHVQSLDLGSLLSDSTRSVEAAIVQLLVEAKRNKPSIIFIPSLAGWAVSISDVARTTMREMLDSLSPTDPILLFGVMNGDFHHLPRDIREWFGYSLDGRIALTKPTESQRSEFFSDVLSEVSRPPNEFPDAVKRRRRILEHLPPAPPLPPRQPSAAEVAAQAEKDRQTLVTLTVRLGPILSDLKKRYRRFVRTVEETHEAVATESERLAQGASANLPSVNQESLQPIDVEMLNGPTQIDSTNEKQPNPTVPHVNGIVNGDAKSSDEQPPISTSGPATDVPATSSPPQPLPKVYDVDFDKMHQKLYDKAYLTPDEFLQDLSRMVHNTRIPPCNLEHAFKAHQMYSEAEAVIWDAQFKLECERMAARDKARRTATKAQTVKDTPPKPTQEGQNATGESSLPAAQGTGAAELPATESNEDPMRLERTLKRPRVDSEILQDVRETAFEETGNRSPAKRAKLSLEDQDETTTVVDLDTARCPIPTESAPTRLSVQFLVDSQPSNSMLVDATSLAQRPSLPATNLPIESVSPTPARTPTPTPQYPPLEVSDTGLRQLRLALTGETSDLTIEQLEHLRAMCLDCVWQRRGDWNRDEMIREMLNIIRNLVREVTIDDPGSP